MMNQRNTLIVIILLALLIFTLWQPFRYPSEIKPESDTSFSDTLSTSDEGFDRVMGPRPFSFPEDFGAHNQYQTEWWYFTGNLQTPDQRKFGYELTFFRYGLIPERIPSLSSWRSRDMYMAHLALTDVDRKFFYTDERFSRSANGLAGASSDKYHVWLYNWSAVSTETQDFPIRLQAKSDQFSIELFLNNLKTRVLQGQQGFSQKNSQPGNASYYYSYTRLETSGKVSIKGTSFPVKGSSWMDREWSTSALAPEQKGWDWFALQLSDNSELMFYQFRRKDNKQDTNNSGAVFTANNKKIPLDYSDVSIKTLEYWKSPHSDITYPSRWHISIPEQSLELDVIPLLNNQELNVTYRYWEGAVRISGIKNGKPVTGQGYVELTGYISDS